MRFGFTLPVTCQFFIECPYTLLIQQVAAELWPTSGQPVLGKIRFSVRLTEGMYRLPSVHSAGTVHRVSTGTPGPEARALVDRVRNLEGLLGFYLRVEKLHWEAIQWHWMPETGEAAPALLDYQEERSALLGLHGADPEFLMTLVEWSPRLDPDVRELLLFWRNGLTSQEAHNFVLGFYHFYFVIEFLFAEGVSNQKEVIRRFEKSIDLRAAIEFAIDTMKSRFPDDAALKAALEIAGEVTPESTIRLLVETRGHLHHAKKTARGGTPVLRAGEYEAHCNLAWLIASKLLESRLVEFEKDAGRGIGTLFALTESGRERIFPR